MSDLTMEILRSRKDYSKLRGKPYGVAFKNSRNQAIRQVTGCWIEDKKHRDSYSNLVTKIGKELNRRPRKGQRRTEPKKRNPGNKPLCVRNIGNKRTREKILADLHPGMDKKLVQANMTFVS